jgi:rhodanese-related sulfurtransferase
MFDLFKSLIKNDAYENLDAREFLTKASAAPDAVLLDVRTAGEFNTGKIEGAINLDFFDSKFAERVGKLDKEKSYFVYCRSGQRSANACRVMHNAGFTKLYNMAGGVMVLG